MTTEILRQAAALMRERAEAAWSSERWQRLRYVNDDPATITLKKTEYVYVKTYCGTIPNADHIASWHPAVALAVADWLEASATKADAVESAGLTFGGFEGTPALAVARAYLGGDQ